MSLVNPTRNQALDDAPLAAFFGPEHRLASVFGQGRREQVLALAREHGLDWLEGTVEAGSFKARRHELARVQVIFSTWGMPALSAEQLSAMPNLRAVFYAAGSVQGFARPFLAREIVVCSAWAANGVPVAEWTLAMILLSNKGFWPNSRAASRPQTRSGEIRGRGNFGTPVSILGAGQIGRKVIELLRPFELQVLVFDPFLPEASAREMGVEKVSLEQAFARGNVVSNHLANLPATLGMLRGEHFAAMQQGATFINTGRGATVAEDEMIAILRARPDLSALLDVTNPEPPRGDSALYELPNVHLTTHLAGSIGDEVVRMADYMIAEFERWARGETLRYAVTPEMLETMA